jgi:hypothetical protein
MAMLQEVDTGLWIVQPKFEGKNAVVIILLKNSYLNILLLVSLLALFILSILVGLLTSKKVLKVDKNFVILLMLEYYMDIQN